MSEIHEEFQQLSPEEKPVASAVWHYHKLMVQTPDEDKIERMMMQLGLGPSELGVAAIAASDQFIEQSGNVPEASEPRTAFGMGFIEGMMIGVLYQRSVDGKLPDPE